MDSIYIVAKRSELTSRKLFHKVIDSVIDQKLIVCDTFYGYQNNIPSIRLKSGVLFKTEFGEDDLPEIEIFIFEEPDLFSPDSNFPIVYNGTDFYPVISMRCRESLFLLSFIIVFLKQNDGLMVCNVENKLMSIDELEKLRSENDYGWAYVE